MSATSTGPLRPKWRRGKVLQTLPGSTDHPVETPPATWGLNDLGTGTDVYIMLLVGRKRIFIFSGKRVLGYIIVDFPLPIGVHYDSFRPKLRT